MKRTQIYFDEDMATDLMLTARSNKLSVSALIREYVQTGLKTNPIKKKAKKGNPLLQLAKAAAREKVPGKRTNVSGNMDKYLPKEWR